MEEKSACACTVMSAASMQTIPVWQERDCQNNNLINDDKFL